MFDECARMLPKVRPQNAFGTVVTLLNPSPSLSSLFFPYYLSLPYQSTYQCRISHNVCLLSLQDMLAYGVVPVLRAVHQDYHDIFLSLARDRLGIDWTPPPSSSRGGEAAEGGGGGLHWDGLLSRLRERRDLCHPEVDVTVLAYLDMGCNVE